MIGRFPSPRGGRSWMAVMSYGSRVTRNSFFAKLTKLARIVAHSEMVGGASTGVAWCRVRRGVSNFAMRASLALIII